MLSADADDCFAFLDKEMSENVEMLKKKNDPIIFEIEEGSNETTKFPCTFTTINANNENDCEKIICTLRKGKFAIVGEEKENLIKT